jgi:hypothetical protein
VSKVLLMGLIGLIPIVGQMVLYGWMLTALDNLRAGRDELPPASFSYIGRGVNLFVVLLLYGLALAAVCLILFGIGFGISVAREGASLAGLPFILLGYALALIGSLALYVLSPAIILATDRGGIGGGLNLPSIISRATASGSLAIYAGLFALVAYLIGGVGAVVCYLGVIFTAPYGYAVLASVVRYYEQNSPPASTTLPVA